MQELGCKPDFVCEAIVDSAPSWNDLKDKSASEIKSMASWTIIFENVFFSIGSKKRVNYDGVKGDVVYKFAVTRFDWPLKQRRRQKRRRSSGDDGADDGGGDSVCEHCGANRGGGRGRRRARGCHGCRRGGGRGGGQVGRRGRPSGSWSWSGSRSGSR